MKPDPSSCKEARTMPLPIHKRAAIQTERLTLKPYAPSDADALTALLTNPQITQTFMVPDYDSPEQFKALAQKLIAFSRIVVLMPELLIFF